MIRNFDLTQKTHILFGAGEENRVGALVKGYADSCLIVHDGGAYLEALLSRVRRSLDDAGVRYEELPVSRPIPSFPRPMRASGWSEGIWVPTAAGQML